MTQVSVLIINHTSFSCHSAAIRVLSTIIESKNLFSFNIFLYPCTRVTLEHDDDNILVHRNDDDEKQQQQEQQPFHFITTVSWIYMNPSQNVKYLSHPELLFSVPPDVFYPFQKQSSSSSSTRENFCVNCNVIVFWCLCILIALCF